MPPARRANRAPSDDVELFYIEHPGRAGFEPFYADADLALVDSPRGCAGRAGIAKPRSRPRPRPKARAKKPYGGRGGIDTHVGEVVHHVARDPVGATYDAAVFTGKLPYRAVDYAVGRRLSTGRAGCGSCGLEA